MTVEKQVAEHARRRAARFSAGNIASWAALLLILALFLSAIHLDLSFMLKWVTFIAGYTTVSSVLIPLGALLLLSAMVAFPASSRRAGAVGALLALIGLYFLTAGATLAFSERNVPGLRPEFVVQIGRGTAAWRLGLAGLGAAVAVAWSAIARGQAARRGRIMLPLLVAGGSCWCLAWARSPSRSTPVIVRCWLPLFPIWMGSA